MLRRWWAPLGAGLFYFLHLLAFAALYYRITRNGLVEEFSKNMKTPPVVSFVTHLILREVLPLYILVGLLLWVLALAWALLPINLGKEWRKEWTWKEALALTWALLAGLHLVLWWKVPSTLWLLPGLSSLPFWLDFMILAPVTFAPMLWVAWRAKVSWARRVSTLAGWCFLAWVAAVGPLALGHRVSRRTNTSGEKTKVLLLGIDGLRADTPGLDQLQGCHFPNAYTAIPATRLLFSMLWGGDPEHYSVGHIFPDIEEFSGKHGFTLLKAAQDKGWKTRFYIDDGGTIGLAGRSELFDEVLMPARGWENFVNSNMGGHVPLYAAWMDLLRVFPGTHPWASMDAGLRKTLENGRGAQMVMFHSCLAHQPIFLDRQELGQLPHWWTLKPKNLVPIWFVNSFNPQMVKEWDSRRNPFVFYQLRNKSILQAWAKIWNNLEQDPDYANATRIFFSDHGERFYHVTENIQMAGVHGFDLDPWQTRVPLIVAGSGFPSGRGSEKEVSLLGVRDAVGALLQHDKAIAPESLNHLPFAPVRYHTLSTDGMRQSGKKYFEITTEKLMTAVAIAPGGFWSMKYDRPAAARAREVSLAQAFEDRLIVFKPLLDGGAHRLEYQGYKLIDEHEISQEAFDIKKAEIEKEYFKYWDKEHK